MAERKWSPPPIPKSVVPKEAFDVGEPAMCGAIEFAPGDIVINEGRPTKEIVMVNSGDRPIQIGAHYHLAECNKAMAFDREAAFGYHLDIPSGTAVRFEPGQSRKVQITTFVGREVAFGMNNMTNGTTRSDIIKRQTMQRLKAAGYCFEDERYPVRTPADKRFGAKKKSK
ncbi:MAG: urease subunit beta [Alphaproteobacteria bacterium]|nr:urease subunit beta [Alphaproteobacteria bacterium]